MSIVPHLVKRLRKVADRLEARHTSEAGRARRTDVLLDEYVTGMPSAQHAIDALPGWNHALPPHVGVTAGEGAFYADPRVLWALEQFGSIAGCRVLELGPLEASHTWLLEQQGPRSLDAIEANKLSYLRCLVVKELLGLQTARFHLGDFSAWLEHTDQTYDLIVASGVLYHMADPVRLVQSIASHTDAFYLWTHYASDEAMPVGDPRRGALVGDVEVQDVGGLPVRLYKRSYYGAWRSKAFCGGMYDLHRWIERDDMLALIRALGFEDLRIADDQPHHRNGPSFSIFARRTSVNTSPVSGSEPSS